MEAKADSEEEQLPVVNRWLRGNKKKYESLHREQEEEEQCQQNNKLIRPIRALLLARHFRSPPHNNKNNNTRSPQMGWKMTEN